MLPIGHLAAGYLTTIGVVKLVKPELDPGQINYLLALGAFWGFAPDLDQFWFFFKNKNFLVAPPGATKTHREFITHAPVVWLLAGLAFYLFGKSEFVKLFGILVWFSSWSHFLLDSIAFGIPWLWPFTNKLYAIKDAGQNPICIEDKNFFQHSLKFLREYSKKISFYLEILIILTALIIFMGLLPNALFDAK